MSSASTPNIFHYRHGRIRIGSARQLNESEVRDLAQALIAPPKASSRALNGRGNVSFQQLSGLGRVVIKRYLRGGFLRFLVQRTYVKWGRTRGELEFDLLMRARAAGINAPEPLVFASRGIGLYEAWLVTREIESPVNFAELALKDETQARELIPDLIQQIGLLIRNRIFHVDLHPGNVVVDGKRAVFLLDFDKASTFKGSPNALRDLYLVRWRRAVIKHGLPEYLSEMVCPGLRRNFEESTA